VQAVLLALALATAPEFNPVRSVDHAVLHPAEVLIRIELERPLAQPPSGFRTFHPAPSIVLELPGASITEKKTLQPERGLVSRIRLVGHAKATRVMIDLTALRRESARFLAVLRAVDPATRVPSGETARPCGACPTGMTACTEGFAVEAGTAPGLLTSRAGTAQSARRSA
jgi:hypothetical protein